MIDRIDAMRMFVRVVESGSFSQAARDLGVGQPTVSKQVAALETRLGTQLIARTSRALGVTPAGQDYYEATLRVLQDLDAAEEQIRNGQAAPSGLVRMTLSPAFGRLFVIPNLPAFRSSFPDVSIEMEVSGRHVDLIDEGIDVAIRISWLADSGLVARRIGDMRMITLASTAYLARHGVPKTLEELRDHERIVYVYGGELVGWGFDVDGRPVTIDGAGSFRTNYAESVRAAVLAGLGIAHHASWLFADELASGEVVQVLAQHVPPPFPIHAVTAAGRRMPSRVRHLIDFLEGICEREPLLSISKAGSRGETAR